MINKTLNWFRNSNNWSFLICLAIGLAIQSALMVSLMKDATADDKVLRGFEKANAVKVERTQQNGAVILAEAKQLTSILKKHAVANNLPAGAEVEFSAIQQYLTPGSDLEKGRGLDVYGAEYGPFIVGRLVPVNKSTKDYLDPYVETDRTSADRDGFWDGH